MSGEMIEAEQLLEQVIQERDNSRKEASRLYEAGSGLIVQLNVALADVERLTAERDAAMVEVRSQVATNRRITVERDAAEDQKEFHRDNFRKLQAECEGLRADLLRITAERDTDRLDLAQVRYERDTALAALKEQHTTNAALWESQQEDQRKADHDEVIIEALREALERTEKRLSQANARQIPPALVGLLGVIRREAAAAEKMIL